MNDSHENTDSSRASEGPTYRMEGSGCLATFVMLFGILLPSLTLGVEWTTGMCAAGFFDPLPTYVHVALIALVPLATGLAVWRNEYRITAPSGPEGLALGGALAVAAAYAVVFVPFLPIALAGLMVGGLGLLPLAPILSVPAVMLTIGSRLRARAIRRGSIALGAVFVVGLLALIQGRDYLTNVAVDRAARATGAERADEVRFLRRFGSEQVLVARCYGIPPAHWRMTRSFDRYDQFDLPRIERVREVHFLVTGRSWEEAPLPRAITGESPFFGERSFDAGRGGSDIGEVVAHLALVESKLDVRAAPDEGFSYSEWELAFENRDAIDHEARLFVQLPPGGVVSRATLWVAGKPREATFAPRAHARQAYERIVRVVRRDPLLVSDAGAGRVLVQCFPVVSFGEPMRIQIGITAPLQRTDDGRAITAIPGIVNSNFEIAARYEHKVSIDVPAGTGEFVDGAGLRDLALSATASAYGRDVYTGGVAQAELARGDALFATRAPLRENVWTPADWMASMGVEYRQLAAELGRPLTARVEWAETQLEPADGVVVVVDVSRSTSVHRAALARLFDELEGDVPIGVVLADDTPVVAAEIGTLDQDRKRVIRRAIERADFDGGIDAEPALQRVAAMVADFEAAHGDSDIRVLWLHGEQPMRFGNERAPLPALPQGDAFTLCALQGRPNVLAAEQRVSAQTLTRVGAPIDDALLWLERAAHGGVVRAPVVKLAGPPPEGVAAASNHVLRLLVANEVRRLDRPEVSNGPRIATELAIEMQLVTPSTSAVVLESDQQTRDAGLALSRDSEVPVLPEPEHVVLLVIALAALGCYAVSRARRRRSAEVGGVA